VQAGVFLLYHPGAQFESITCIGNEMILTGGGGWAFGACDVCASGPSGSITNATILNNIVRYPGWSSRPLAEDGGLLYSDIRHAIFANNVVALGTSQDLRVRHYPAGIIFPPGSSEDCEGLHSGPPGEISYPPSLDELRPGYKRAWYNNRDLSGALLNVRFWNSGLERPASQQQWPE
jgi:hypothetical protein